MKQGRALIVGAGIGGPVLGILLRELGFEVTLAEARPALAQGEGAFLGVAPNGMNVLDSIGLLGPAGLPGGHACHGFRFTNHAGRSIGEIDRRADREQFSWPLTMVRRSDLHAFLSAAAKARGLEIHYGLSLESLELGDSKRVTARFSDGSTVEADFVIGCDGLRSATRKLALPDAPAPYDTGMLDCGGFAPAGDIDLEPGINLMLFGRRAFFGAFRTEGDEVWWFHNGPPLEGADLRSHLLELHRDDAAWVSTLVRATPNILGPWPLREMRAMPRWSHGRVCLLGDAAHAMSPSAGQGASLAFEDAVVLAQCLEKLGEPQAAFQRFEERRRPRVDAIAKEAARQSSNKAPSAISAWFRDRLLPLFLRAGAAAQTKAYSYRVGSDSMR